jgi:uncharacterized heparinase superfamily protein
MTTRTEQSNCFSHIKDRLKAAIYKILQPNLISAHSMPRNKFLKLFDIRQVNKLGQTEDFELAETALIDYYRDRKVPIWPEPRGMITDLRLNLDKLKKDELIQTAESILAYQFLPKKKKPVLSDSGDIQWNRNPISSPEWLWRLHRHQWWPILGLAYRLTGEERYAREFVKQMLSWIISNPMLKRKNERSFAWRLMECGMRMHVSWIPSFGLFFESPVFDRKAKITMLRSIYDHAQFLASFKTSQNHLLRESNGLAAVSVYFPEFRQSQRWLQTALNRLDAELKSQINPDGFHFELSTGYQWVVIDEFEKTHALLNIANRSLPTENISARLEKMYNVLAYISRPDGSLPEVNDGFIRWPIDRLVNAGKQFRRSDFNYIGTNGKRGNVPQITSVAFENAGYYIMRSDWSQNANYLLFDSGPYNGYHAHEDKLSVEVFAFGTPFIVDSGSYTYENTDPYRAYFVGSESHNTLMVDECSQIRRWRADGLTARKSSGDQAVWIHRPGFDYAAGIYEDGYGRFALRKPEHPDIIKDVIHARKILFVRPDYWIIIDEIQAQKPHNYQLLFHGHPESEIYVEAEKAAIIKSKRNSACVYLIPAEIEKIQIDKKTGCETPIQGWYSVDHHYKTPSTALIYEIKNTESTIITTLVFPHKGTPLKNPVKIMSLDVSEGGGIAYIVDIEKGTDYLMVSNHKGLKKFGDFQAYGTVAGFRLDKKGKIRSRFEG